MTRSTTLVIPSTDGSSVCRAARHAASVESAIIKIAISRERHGEPKKLAEVRGIGDTLQTKIATLVTTGGLKYLDELRASIPVGLVQMLRLRRGLRRDLAHGR